MQLPTPSTLMGGTGTIRELAMMLCSICLSLRSSAPQLQAIHTKLLDRYMIYLHHGYDSKGRNRVRDLSFGYSPHEDSRLLAICLC